MNMRSISCSTPNISEQHQLRISSLLAELKECSFSRDLPRGLRAHAQASSTGLDSNFYVITSLINMYAKCGRMPEAQKLFESSPHRSVGAWTSLIRGYAENGDSHEALQTFEAMKRAGVSPNSRTYVAALSACNSSLKSEARENWLERGRGIHLEAVNQRIAGDIYVANTLVNMYAKLGSMREAKLVFDGMVERDVVSWNSILQGFVDNGDSELSLELLDKMRVSSSVPPDARSFIAGLSACAALASAEERGSSRCRRWLTKGKALHSLAITGKCCTVFVECTLVDMYSKCGQMQLARRVFDEMSSCTVVAWTALVSGYVRNGDNELALKLISAMDLNGVQLNSLTFVAALEACGSLMALRKGREFHAEIESLFLTRDIMVANSLIDFYSKCGSMSDAEEIFNSINRKTIVSWTALMSGYSLQGCTGKVFELFEKMKERDIKPNGVTFVCLLTAYSHAGLTDRGKELFNSMKPLYGVSPNLQHHNCMVDLLGRANCLEEALVFISGMPSHLRPNIVTWKTILSACMKWNNVSLGRLAYEALVEIDENNASSCVLMANILDISGGEPGVNERPRCRTWWIDQTGMVHGFERL